MDQYQSLSGLGYGITQEEAFRQQQQAYFHQLAMAQQNANPFGAMQIQLGQTQAAKPTDDPLLVLLTED